MPPWQDCGDFSTVVSRRAGHAFSVGQHPSSLADRAAGQPLHKLTSFPSITEFSKTYFCFFPQVENNFPSGVPGLRHSLPLKLGVALDPALFFRAWIAQFSTAREQAAGCVKAELETASHPESCPPPLLRMVVTAQVHSGLMCQSSIVPLSQMRKLGPREVI